VAVPELTRNAGIQFNERVSLRHDTKAIALLDRTLSRPDPPGQSRRRHTPPGGFVSASGRTVIKNPDNLDQWGDVFDRRSIGRTKISKGALLFFSEKTGVHSCTVRDITNLGAGVRIQDLKVVPLDFALSFDNFRSVHMCLLIWRQGDFLGVAFKG
jgi:hypothetical protein